MNKRNLAAACTLALLALAGCRSSESSGVFAARKGVPNEFAVGRAAPLTVPPDFAMVPPKPGQPRPQDADSSQQALDVLFGGRRPVSQGEQALLQSAGPAAPAGVRSQAGSNNTTVVDKGAATRDIINAPASSNPQANATTPQ
ncbi:DUF3035 domain-containing protein [uncultured Sphingomonas sp.]|uniref:DUF3035 domain-containing protein n=1 Tax=uncultured Sphingomonas sp. TaxID=158754 RepID=UPI0026013FE4|nr:DUF3035 domain-containing protein [uncultured Sphingomonas sp.]